MTFIDFFSGIGGFRLGMEMNSHECLGHCEIDKFADKSYRAIYNVKEGEWYADDIRNVKAGDLPEADCWCAGFPCQTFSIAGKRRGFEDTRGTLIFEIFRLAAERKPKILFLENVAGLLSHDKGRTFATILNGLWELGYNVQWQVLNSKNFGVPQNRERVFIIGHFGEYSGREVFPISESDREITVVQRQQNTVKCLTTRYGETTGAYIIESEQYAQIKQLNNPKHSNDRVYSEFSISPTLNTMQGGNRQPFVSVQAVLTPDRKEKRQNGRRIKDANEPMFTLTGQDQHGVTIKEATKKGYAEANVGDDIYLNFPNNTTRRGRVGKGIIGTLDTGGQVGTIDTNHRIRRLTPRECFRLQGFPDEYFERAAKVNSDSQLYKQAGNSVTVNVIYVIASKLGG